MIVYNRTDGNSTVKVYGIPYRLPAGSGSGSSLRFCHASEGKNNYYQNSGERIMKRIKQLLLFCVLLCAVLAFAACGDDAGNSGTTAEFVYVPEYVSVPGEVESIQSPRYHDGMVYFTSWGYQLNGEMIASSDIKEEDWANVVSSNFLYKVSIDGTGLTLLPNYQLPEIPEGMDGSVSLQNMDLDGEGNIWVVESIYLYPTEPVADDGTTGASAASPSDLSYEMTEQYLLRKLDPDGGELAKVDLTSLGEGRDYFYVSNMAVDNSGNVYIGCDNTLYVLDAQGNRLFDLEEENWINSLACLADGTVGACVYNGESGYEVRPVDIAARSWGTSMAMPYNAHNIYPGSGEYAFYCEGNGTLYGYHTANGTCESLLNWINSDINSNDVRGMAVLDDGRILCITTNYDTMSGMSKTEFALLTKTPSSEVPQKTTLRLAAVYLDYNLRGTIINFNKTNQEYRIEVTDYSDFNTAEDYNAGVTKLTADIISGNIPDIICTGQLPVHQYIAKGLLEDLYPYIDSDSDLGREALVQSVFRALEVDGGLYEVMPSFSLQVLLGNSDYVGTEFTTTMDDLQALMAANPQASLFSPYFTRDAVLQYFLLFNINDFVDWASGECSFDNESFTSILELAASFPQEYNWDEETVYRDERQMLADGEMLFSTFYAYDFNELQTYNAALNGKAVFKGFPGSDGNGVMMNTSTGLAMSSTCEHKEGAWQFIRIMLTEDYQQQTYDYPTNQHVLDEKIAEAMAKEFSTDENGNQIEVPKYTFGMSTGDGSNYQEFEVYAATQEEIDKYLDLIERVDSTYRYDEKLMAIITEETAPFFAGQRSAAETASIIQSRAKIYVNEQR